jgi:hypothetical protein
MTFGAWSIVSLAQARDQHIDARRVLPVAVVVGASRVRCSAGRIFALWSQWWYWVSALVCGWIAFAVSGRLVAWTPGRGLMSEMLSLLVRLGFVFTLDVLLVRFVLAVIVVGLRRGVVSPISE